MRAQAGLRGAMPGMRVAGRMYRLMSGEGARRISIRLGNRRQTIMELARAYLRGLRCVSVRVVQSSVFNGAGLMSCRGPVVAILGRLSSGLGSPAYTIMGLGGLLLFQVQTGVL